jgi:hypothetical protein
MSSNNVDPVLFKGRDDCQGDTIGYSLDAMRVMIPTIFTGNNKGRVHWDIRYFLNGGTQDVVVEGIFQRGRVQDIVL